MKDVISPVERELLKKELNSLTFLRPTCKANNEIYDITVHNAPNTMREIARLRELAFRAGGGGTGLEMDIDHYDTRENAYHQLIVWDPEHEEIVGGYRYLLGSETREDEHGQPDWVSSHMLKFSEKFLADYKLKTVELGRAFVQPKYQTAEMGARSIFALDNLWEGLGAVIYNKRDEIDYLIGKVTIYRQFDELVRDVIYAYLELHFPDREGLMTQMDPMSISEEAQRVADELFDGESQVEDYKALQKFARDHGEHVPPLFHAYIGLSETMMTFGTGVNVGFGEVYDTGLMITVADLHEEKRKRYIESYVTYLESEKNK